MTPATLGNIILAALLAMSGIQLTRTLDLVDKLAERVQGIEVRLAVVEAKQP